MGVRVHKTGEYIKAVGVENHSVRRGGQIGSDGGNFAVSQQNVGLAGVAVDSVMDEAVVDKGSCHSIVSLGFFPIVLY